MNKTIIKKESRVVHKNSEKCIAYEYPFETKALNIAYIEINGRYPDSGSTINEQCEEIVYVISGTGKVVIDGKEFEIKESDQIHINKNKKFYWDDCKDLKIAVSCAPAWSPEQYKYVKS